MRRKRAVLVGHSMGTPVARQFYRKYPQNTLAIVIVDGALRPFGDKKMMDGLSPLFAAQLQRGGAQMFCRDGWSRPNTRNEGTDSSVVF